METLHSTHLKDLCKGKENHAGHNFNNSIKFEIGQPVFIKKSHASYF